GTLLLGGASTSFTGLLFAEGGTLDVSADFSASRAVSASGTTLRGTGVVKEFLPGSGTIQPGSGGAGYLATALDSTSASSLSGATLQVDLNDAGTSSQVALGDASTINLGSAHLSVNLVHSSAGALYTILSSTTGGISGAFVGLPDN